MNDPARQERIEVSTANAYTIAELLQKGDLRRLIEHALEAADAIEPRPVYLTAEERVALSGAHPWGHGEGERSYLQTLNMARNKLQAAQGGE